MEMVSKPWSIDIPNPGSLRKERQYWVHQKKIKPQLNKTDWSFILADGLKEVMVSSFKDINSRMDEGTVNRTVASTNMNATSSR